MRNYKRYISLLLALSILLSIGWARMLEEADENEPYKLLSDGFAVFLEQALLAKGCTVTRANITVPNETTFGGFVMDSLTMPFEFLKPNGEAYALDDILNGVELQSGSRIKVVLDGTTYLDYSVNILKRRLLTLHFPSVSLRIHTVAFSYQKDSHICGCPRYCVVKFITSLEGLRA